MRLTRADALVVALALLASGAGSLLLGQDLSFDLLSYHFYNGYAFSTGRLDRDIAAAGWHTYISPPLDALGYLGMTGLPPRVFGFLLGALHGVNVALVYLLARVVLSASPHARLLAGATALLSALGPNAVSLLGLSAGNNLVSIPVLAALLLLAWPSSAEGEGWSQSRLLAAAALCGAAVGLRLTAGADLLAVCAAALAGGAWPRPLAVCARQLAALAAGSLLGFAATGGVWAWRMAVRFGNPLFPFANQLFRSPYFGSVYLRDARWVARCAWDYVRPPIDLALGRMDRLQEIGARDARYLALVLALAALLVLALAGRRSLAAARIADRLVLAYALVGYFVWAAAFYYYRYMTTLELVTPLALLIVLRALLAPRALLPAFLVLSLVLAAWSRAESWGRGEWRDNWFGLELPALARRPDSLVLLVGGPVSYALPFFPPSDRFAHLTALRDKGGSELIDRKLTDEIERHDGPLLLLSSFRVDRRAQDPATRRPRWTYDSEEDAGPAAARFGLALTDRCEDMRTRRGPLYLCEVERARP